MKWLNLAGQEVESNDHPSTVKALEDAGWTLASEAEAKTEAEAGEQMEIEAPKTQAKTKGKK